MKCILTVTGQNKTGEPQTLSELFGNNCIYAPSGSKIVLKIFAPESTVANVVEERTDQHWFERWKALLIALEKNKNRQTKC